MGLGKTLTMIALIASDLVDDTRETGQWKDIDSMRSVAVTLIIVPQPRKCNAP